MYSCRVLADSMNPHGIRYTTLLASYPRFVHAEFMTHRVFSRNAGSNRAIPVAKLLSAVTSDPVIPIYWGKNQRGMVAGEEFTLTEVAELNAIWLAARDSAVRSATELMDKGVHKSIPNRLLEPWQWITVVVSATEWANFFNLRIDDAAEVHIRRIAEMMYCAIRDSEPKELKPGEWHLPFISEQDREQAPDVARAAYAAVGNDLVDMHVNLALAKISAARTARTSYLNHEGVRDLIEDVTMCDQKLIAPGHWSPLEHPAVCMDDRVFRGNIRGFRQFRKFYPKENRKLFDGSRLAKDRASGNAGARA